VQHASAAHEQDDEHDKEQQAGGTTATAALARGRGRGDGRWEGRGWRRGSRAGLRSSDSQGHGVAAVATKPLPRLDGLPTTRANRLHSAGPSRCYVVSGQTIGRVRLRTSYW